MEIAGVQIDATFAEAFDMQATRIIITAADRQWVQAAATSMTGFGTSVIACGVEIGIEQELSPAETPDGRPGVAILAFAVSAKELEKQIPRRAGQCVLTCPTTSLFAGITAEKHIPLGKTLRYFGDGYQISKVLEGLRYWRIPVMDGEFVCQDATGRVPGIGGGNLILIGDSVEGVVRGCRAAATAIAALPHVITPFAGGATRSGSKVGSKYRGLVASTNQAYCPALRGVVASELSDEENCVLEIVIDGLSSEAVGGAMRAGIHAACEAAGTIGLRRISAGNYGGKLGRHHFHLAEVLR